MGVAIPQEYGGAGMDAFVSYCARDGRDQHRVREHGRHRERQQLSLFSDPVYKFGTEDQEASAS